MATRPQSRYVVLRDNREQAGWNFYPSVACAGTEAATLPTGDYTLKGYESLFVIERKGSMNEFATNLFQDRFERELDRLDEFAHPYLFLEFNWQQLIEFPTGSGIPTHRWKYLRAKPAMLMKRYTEMRLAHPNLRVEFVGPYGKEVASCLFKRIVENGPGKADKAA